MLDPITMLQQAIAAFRNGLHMTSQALSERVSEDVRQQIMSLLDLAEEMQTLAVRSYDEKISDGVQYAQLVDKHRKLEELLARYKSYCTYEAKPGVYVYATHEMAHPPKGSQWRCRQCEDKGTPAPLEFDGQRWSCRYCSFGV